MPAALKRLSLSLALAIGVAMPAAAQQRIQIGDLVQRLERLESEVTRMRVSPRQGGSDVARLDQIEAELRRLTGIIERIEFENRRLADRTDKRLEDFEDRVQDLENAPPVETARGSTYDEGQSAFSTASRGGVEQAYRAPEYTPPAALPQISPTPLDQQVTMAPPIRINPQTAAPEGGGFTPSPIAVQPSGQGAEALYQEGLRLLNVGAFDEAGAQFEELIAAYPSDPRAGQAQYWLGDMHFKLGRFEQAATAFLDSFRNWPEGAKAPDSLLKLGMTLANIGKMEEACLSFSQLPARYPTAAPGLLRRAEIEGQRAGCRS